jgi:hypothetical protein
MQIARVVFAGMAWLFVALVVVQVFLAGLGMFGTGGMGQHRDFGYLVASFPLLVLIAGAVARAGRLAWWSAGLLILATVQSILPVFATGAPFVAALHPVNALVLAGLGLLIARRATALVGERRREPTASAATANV